MPPAPHSENSPTSRLDPLHSPGSDAEQQPRSALFQPTLSAQDAGPTFGQKQAISQKPAEPMKTKRRMFGAPLLRRSATASSNAAARIKSNLSTVTKLPTALKRSTTSSANAAAVDNQKAHVDRAPTVPSLARSSTDSSVKQEQTKQHSRMFGIPSLMRIRTGSKDKTHTKPSSPALTTTSGGPLESPEARSEHSTSETEETSEHHAQTSAINSASRFVMGMPTMLRRAVSSNHTPPTAPVANQKKSPDTSANSTPRGDFPEDDLEENDRHSLLLMLQVPEAQRRSQIPLMAVSEAW